MYEGRSKNNLGVLTQADLNCRGQANFSIYVPDNKQEAIQALFDSNGDRSIDVIIEDFDRDERLHISFQDVDFDGTIDLVGFHPDGKLRASKFEKSDPKRKYAGR
jgi:hypothetical protein